MNSIRFNNALSALYRELVRLPKPEREEIILMRDLYGHLRMAVHAGKAVAGKIEKNLSDVWKILGVYADYPGPHVLCDDDFFDPESVFNDPDIIEYLPAGEEISIRLMDRQVTGQAWARVQGADAPDHPHRVVFFGVKGGVGRSTALALSAYRFGREGKKVLLLDMDLESPGLSGILLDPSSLPENGICDWFVEDAAGSASGIIPSMTITSLLSSAPGFRGRIEIAPAFGLEEKGYLPKLSRVFMDLRKGDNKLEHFGDRAERLILELEKRCEPDIVLIDSRAGLHDLAAVALTRLADTALLFATNSPQTWESYRHLFVYWQERPAVLRHVRDKIAMVYALAAQGDRDAPNRFRDNAYDLFSTTIYESIPAGEAMPDAFNFDIADTTAPHYPVPVYRDSVFHDFSVKMISDEIITDTTIEAVYGRLFGYLDARLGERR